MHIKVGAYSFHDGFLVVRLSRVLWLCVCGTLTLQSIYIPLKIGWRIHCVINDYETLEFSLFLSLSISLLMWNGPTKKKIIRQQHRMLSPHIFWHFFVVVVVIVIQYACTKTDCGTIKLPNKNWPHNFDDDGKKQRSHNDRFPRWMYSRTEMVFKLQLWMFVNMFFPSFLTRSFTSLEPFLSQFACVRSNRNNNW